MQWVEFGTDDWPKSHERITERPDEEVLTYLRLLPSASCELVTIIIVKIIPKRERERENVGCGLVGKSPPIDSLDRPAPEPRMGT